MGLTGIQAHRTAQKSHTVQGTCRQRSALGKSAAIGRSKAGFSVSGWRAPRQRGNQVHLIGVAQDLPRVRLTAVDDEQD